MNGRKSGENGTKPPKKPIHRGEDLAAVEITAPVLHADGIMEAES